MDKGNVRYLKNNVKKGDLIRTRDTKGQYYLGKVLSGWEYCSDQEAKRADIVNIVRCKIIKIEFVNDVPGKIAACFRSTRTIQSIKAETAFYYSKYLWNQISKHRDYELKDDGPEGLKNKDIYQYLSSENVEDVIFIYLQMQGWVIVPHSRGKPIQ